MESDKTLIIKYLEGQGGWVFGGVIEDYMRAEFGTKGGTTSKRLRELTWGDSPILEKDLIQVNGEGPQVVRYRIVRIQIPVRGVDSKSEEVKFNHPKLL